MTDPSRRGEAGVAGARGARWVSHRDARAIAETHALAIHHFGPTVDPARYADILAVAYPVLACTFDDAGRVSGYLDVFPLRPAAAALLYGGQLGERDLGAEHVRNVHDAASLGAGEPVVLYVGGVAVRHPGSYAGGRDAAALVALLLATARAVEATGRVVELVAARASDAGARLIARQRGVRIPGAAVDGFPLFRLALD